MVVLLLAVIGIGVYYLFLAEPPIAADNGATQPVAPKDPEPRRDPPVDPTPVLTELQVESRPLGAEVFLAGDRSDKPLGVTPFTAKFTPEQRRVQLVFRLKGYREKASEAGLDKSGKVVVELERIPEKKPVVPIKKPDKPTTPGNVDKSLTLDPFKK
jgi:hypothetical protein